MKYIKKINEQTDSLLTGRLNMVTLVLPTWIHRFNSHSKSQQVI